MGMDRKGTGKGRGRNREGTGKKRGMIGDFFFHYVPIDFFHYVFYISIVSINVNFF